MATPYHPTAEQAVRPIRSLLDNEVKAISEVVSELRRRTLNKARLEAALMVIEETPSIEEDESERSETSSIARRVANGGA